LAKYGVQSVRSIEYGVLLEGCPPYFLNVVGDTHPAQGFKQTLLNQQLYAEVQRRFPIGDPIPHW
jgi:hypothetical protein